MRYVVGNGIRLFAVERSPLEVGTEREAPFVEIPSQAQSGSMRKIVSLIHARHLVNELFAQVGHAVALKRLLVGVAVAVRELIVGAQLHVVHYRLRIHQVGAQRCLLLVVVLALRIFRGRCRAVLGLAFLIVGVGVAALVGYLSVHRQRQRASLLVEAVAVGGVKSGAVRLHVALRAAAYAALLLAIQEVFAQIAAQRVAALIAELRAQLQGVVGVYLIFEVHVHAVVPVGHVRLAVLHVRHARQCRLEILALQLLLIVVRRLVEEVARRKLQLVVPFIHIVQTYAVGLGHTAERAHHEVVRAAASASAAPAPAL